MSIHITVCRGCEDRMVGCHSACARYNAESAAIAEARENAPKGGNGMISKPWTAASDYRKNRAIKRGKRG